MWLAAALQDARAMCAGVVEKLIVEFHVRGLMHPEFRRFGLASWHPAQNCGLAVENLASNA